jgi:hypothetical protein
MSATPTPRHPSGTALESTGQRGAGRRTRRRPVRPLGDGTTERVRIIEFMWAGGTGVQPVLFLDRQLLD